MDPITALQEGRAFADLSRWRKLLVRGGDARPWLNDLVTAEVGHLEAGESAPSLLLTPTGRIRAAFTVALLEDGFVLAQDPEQPEALADLLAPYTLSSRVALDDRTAHLALLAFPGGDPPLVGGAEVCRPSCLGAGADVFAPRAERDELRRAAEGFVEAGPEHLDAWRIAGGVPRYPVDLTAESLPHEDPLMGASIAYDKGCFLGQEAVARVRNLGHPPFVLMPVRAGNPVQAGDPVLADGRVVGRITSSTAVGGDGFAAIARIRWSARESELATASGVGLER